MGLDNMTAVEERHLAIGLDPDLVAGVFGEYYVRLFQYSLLRFRVRILTRESSDVKSEFP